MADYFSQGPLTQGAGPGSSFPTGMSQGPFQMSQMAGPFSGLSQTDFSAQVRQVFTHIGVYFKLIWRFAGSLCGRGLAQSNGRNDAIAGRVV